MTWRSGSVRGVGLALLCVLLVLFPLFAGPGPVNTRGGGDSPFLLVRLEQLVAGLRSGAFPVRWMPDAAYGLGYPFFHFYAALPYYVAAVFRLLGWGPIASLQVTQALGLILAAAAMALLGRRVFRHPAAVTLAVVAYTCAPFHLVNVYVRGDSLSEFYAFAFYPLIFWTLLRLHDAPSLPRVAALGISLGGLALTHNLSVLMVMPFVVVYALLLLLLPRATVRGEQRSTSTTSETAPAAGVVSARSVGMVTNARTRTEGRSRRGTGAFAPSLWPGRLWTRTGPHRHWAAGGMVLSGMLGLAVSATLWLPVLVDLDKVWMGVKDIQTSGFFNYASQFRPLMPQPDEGQARTNGLIQPALWFNYDLTETNTPFAMGAVQAATIGLGAVVAVVGIGRRARARSDAVPVHIAFWLVGLAGSTLMILPFSHFLWDHVPVLPIVQFPWRFLSIQAFFGALLVGGLAEHLPRPWWIATIGTLLLTCAAVGSLHPEYLPIDDADVTPGSLALFESFTTNIGTTIRGEYLPAGVEPRPMVSRITLDRNHEPRPMVLAGEITEVALLARNARMQRWQATVRTEGALLAFPTYDFPGWRAYRSVVGAQEEHVEIEPLPNSGLISIHLPQGKQTITLRFERTAARWIADGLSMAGSIACAVLAGPSVWQVMRTRRRREWVRPAGGLLVVGLFLMLGRVVSSAESRFAPDDVSMDFDRMPFLHHNPNGVSFGPVRLVSCMYEETAHGGEMLTVACNWSRPAPELTADVRLVTPADPHPALAPAAPPLADDAARIDSLTTTHMLDVPANAATGPYYLALRVMAGDREIRAVGDRGNVLGTVYLRPIWIDNPRPAGQGDPVLARFGEDILLRDDIQVRSDRADWEVWLTWQATKPIGANYTLSLRLLSADGVPVAQRDFAEGPGYGFWPTSAWPTGEWWTDRLRVPVPSGGRAEDAVALSVVLYDRSQPDFPAAGSVIVPLREREHQYQTPAMERQLKAMFGQDIELLGYDVAQGAHSLRLTLYWRARQRVSVDGIVFVHLFDQRTEQIVAQSDARPQNGTYPTEWWRVSEVVSDQVTLALTDVPAGQYRLAVGMCSAEDGNRLPISEGLGETLPEGRLILAEELLVSQ